MFKSSAISINRERRSYITNILITGILFMAMLYAWNVYAIISRTVAVEKLEKQAATLQNSVQSLDAEYIALSSKITPDLAKHYGLHEGSVSAYIPRTPSLGSAQTLARDI